MRQRVNRGIRRDFARRAFRVCRFFNVVRGSKRRILQCRQCHPKGRLDSRTGRQRSTTEMPFRKGASRARLQVLLEAQGLLLSAELNRDGKRPRTMSDCVPAGTCVVPDKSVPWVARDSDITASRIRLAAQNVDEPPFRTSHVIRVAYAAPQLNGAISCGTRRSGFQYAFSDAGNQS